MQSSATAARAAATRGVFAYYFPDADGLSGADLPQKLDLLADAMVEAGEAPAQNSRLPVILTYFGQFVDHDITANTDRDTALSVIEGNITALPRGDVTSHLENLRDGSLRLDSVYGDSVGQGPFADKVAGLMRHPTFNGKMRLGTTMPTGSTPPRPPLPGDPAADLLRLGRLIDTGELTEAELSALNPPELRDTFFKNGALNRSRAIIGDDRNDENLLVAQFHVAMLRLHNALRDRAANFEEARQLTRWHYQWLVTNHYLRLICDQGVAQQVLADRAPLYDDFFTTAGAPNGTTMPMPLEFSVAAFRFGHSMVRGAYDHNRLFGEAKNGSDPIIPDEVPFEEFFRFTGGGQMRELDLADGRLPSNWIIEWERFVHADPSRPIRSARKIDTFISDPLFEMFGRPAGLMQVLAKRNLRRGLRLNVPHAQACIDALAAKGITVEPLTAAELTSGPTGTAVEDGGFVATTPLWFYILKEAEVRTAGEHLGPLGSHLVANTLVGLIAKDPTSYLNATPEWHPRQSVTFGDGDFVDGFPNMMRFIGMLR